MSDEESVSEEKFLDEPSLGDLAREVRMHRCRCLLVHPITEAGGWNGHYLNRCEQMLPVDQPLCDHCEAVHLTQIDPIFYSKAYMMLVPPEIP